MQSMIMRLVVNSVCVCVCQCVCVRVYLLVTTVSPTEMAGLIKVPFVIWIQVGLTVY